MATQNDLQIDHFNRWSPLFFEDRSRLPWQPGQLPLINYLFVWPQASIVRPILVRFIEISLVSAQVIIAEYGQIPEHCQNSAN